MTVANATPGKTIITTPTQTDTNTNCAIIVTKSMKSLIQHTSGNTLSEPENNKEHHDSDRSVSILNSSLDSE